MIRHSSFLIIALLPLCLVVAACPKEAAEPAKVAPQPAKVAPRPAKVAPQPAKVAPGAPPATPADKTLQMLTVGADEGVYDAEMQELGAQAVRRVTVGASSVLCEPRTGFCHAPSRAVDNKSDTAWCEGAEGTGVGATLTLDLGRPRKVVGIRFEPAYAKNKRVMFDNARIKKLAIVADGGRRMGAAFADQDPTHAFKPGMQLDFSAPTVGFAAPLLTRKLVLEVLEVYPGSRFSDLCVSEVTIYAK